MKRQFSVLLVSLVGALCVATAQTTAAYTAPQTYLNDGIDLYQQAHYTASYQALETYLHLVSPVQGAQAGASLDQAQFYLIANAFELRQTDALKRLQAYLVQYPYSNYASSLYFMIGALQAEKGKYKQALKSFDEVKMERLFRPHQPQFLFLKAYAHLQLNEYQKALPLFKQLKAMESIYQSQAQYYYAFCQYHLQNYGKALPDFLALEHTSQYQQIVPYYLVQIYYQQRQYNEVIERANDLLATYPTNPNNGELHRILGEIQYQQADYTNAIEHLIAYTENYKAQSKPLLRNDLYLLGMSYYQLGDYPAAIPYLHDLKKENDALSQNACYHLGNAYQHTQQIQPAKMAYAAAMRYTFNDTIRENAMYNYALTTYQSASPLGESITALTNFLQTYPHSQYQTSVYELLCEAFVSSKNYEQALSTLYRIPSLTPKMQETKRFLQYQLGANALAQKKYTAARDTFATLVKEAPASSVYKTEAYYLLAEAEYKLQNYAAAVSAYQHFEQQPKAQQSDNYPFVNYNLGYAFFSQQDYTHARPYFETYVQAAPHTHATYADALNRLGDIDFTARNFVSAEQQYAKVIALGATGVDYALFQRGYTLGLIKRYDDKVKVMESLVKRYPKSDYADDGLYEIARSYVIQEQNQSAIHAYDRLLSAYPNSSNARKAALEKGMLYYNMHNYPDAIASYKQVIQNYPGSEEAYSALDGLQSAYVETNNIAEYLAYTKTLGRINMTSTAKEDSLTFAAAERQYILLNYQEAAAGLGKYLSQYCTGGRYCTLAQYELADCYQQLQQTDEALTQYQALAALTGNPYQEEACLRVAQLQYDKADYAAAKTAFEQLQGLASSLKNADIARLGVLRCAYNLGDHNTTIQTASRILEDIDSSPALQTEAAYNRGKAYYALQQYDLAFADLRPLAAEVTSATGAESKYLLCEGLFQQGKLDLAEAEVMDFASQNTQQQYWLAKCFLLLSDIYVQRGDDFQAKQYLYSLQANYHTQDDIQPLLQSRLQSIEERENEKVDDLTDPTE